MVFLKSLLVFITLCIFYQEEYFIHAASKYTNDYTQTNILLSRIKRGAGGKERPVSWAPNMNILIKSQGRNIVIPKKSENVIPIYRAEAEPNSRLSKDGVPSKPTKDGKQSTLFIAIGSDPKRTDDFMQQGRHRETKHGISIMKDLANSFRKMFFPLNYKVPKGEVDYKAEISNAVEELKFDAFSASGQTVKRSYISASLGRDIIAKSVPEQGFNEIAEKQRKLGIEFGSSKDVLNVDVTKAHNQFGVRGDTLEKVRNEIAIHKVKEGTTYGDRRRSAPDVLISHGGQKFLLAETLSKNSNKKKTAKPLKQSTSKQGPTTNPNVKKPNKNRSYIPRATAGTSKSNNKGAINGNRPRSPLKGSSPTVSRNKLANSRNPQNKPSKPRSRPISPFNKPKYPSSKPKTASKKPENSRRL